MNSHTLDPMDVADPPPAQDPELGQDAAVAPAPQIAEGLPPLPPIGVAGDSRKPDFEINLVASNASELPALEFNLADFSLKDLPELSLNDMLNLI